MCRFPLVEWFPILFVAAIVVTLFTYDDPERALLFSSCRGSYVFLRWAARGVISLLTVSTVYGFIHILWSPYLSRI